MDRRQPAMPTGGGATRARARAPEARGLAPDDAGEAWRKPTVMGRGWAFTRLVALVVGCGIGAGITLSIAIWLTLAALDTSL